MCQPTSLLVGVPFIAFDVRALERTWQMWEHFPPRLSDTGSGPGLLYLFNGRCDSNDTAVSAACARVKRHMQGTTRIGGRRAFGRVVFLEAQLSGRYNEYDKRRNTATWTAGPNSMFNLLISHARRLGYRHLLQLEPDVLPIRAGWLDRVACLAAISDAWVIGSALYANCTHDIRTGRCERELPERFVGHINGNAIYAVGDDTFARYAKAIRYGRTRNLPFDLALHVLRDTYDQPRRRQLMHRFQHSNFVINMGTAEPDIPALNASQPNAFLVHSSAFGKMDAARLFSLFVVHPAPAAPAATAPAAPAAAAHPGATGAQPREKSLDLGPLRAVASADGSAIVTFVAGGKYGDMCRNFVAHAQRARVEHLLLVAMDSPSLDLVRAFGVPAIDASHLVSLPAGASDAFGSAAFFAVNGARYFALLEMLRAGFNLFILDLDVVLLRDPIKWLAAEGSALARNDILVQSDARDGVSTKEFDPSLVTKRLGLPAGQGWTYANGGIFFCRSTPKTIAMFGRLWSVLSSAATPPNEQDMLNRELASADGLAWGLLPAGAFPNGFVYFYRPIPSMADPVLVHANWINGVREKIYHLREAGLWSVPPPARPTEEAGAPRILSVREGCVDHGRCDVHSALRALRDALAIAHVLNRTLVLPRFPLQRQRPDARAKSISHFLDYSSFADHFPNHAALGPESGHRTGAALVHVDVGGARDAPSAGLGFVTVGRRDSAPSLPGETQIKEWLAPFASAAHLHLSTTLDRFGAMGSSRDQREFERRLARGVRLSPRLMTVAYESRAAMVREVAEYDCVDASQASDYEHLLRGAARSPTHAELLKAAAQKLAPSPRTVLVVGVSHSREAIDRSSSLLSNSARLDRFVPRWLVTDYDTSDSNTTEALAAVEAEVCAHAQRFVGNLAAASTYAICRRRRAIEKRKSKKGAARFAVSPCEDVLSRTLPASAGKLLLEQQ